MSKLKDQLRFEEEIWIPVNGFEGLYEVSNLGRVKSLPKIDVRDKNPNGSSNSVFIRKTKEKILKPSVQRIKNYLRYRVNLRKDGKTYQTKVHHIVLTSFYGPPLDGQICRHLDGNALNNNILNLAWGTMQENVDDSINHGTKTNPPIRWGENHHNSKMTDLQIQELRSSGVLKKDYKYAALKYGVRTITIKRILDMESRA